MCASDDCGPKNKTRCCSTVPDCRDLGGLIKECPPPPDDLFMQFEKLMSKDEEEMKEEKAANVTINVRSANLTCDENICQNDGDCLKVNNAPYCNCKSGYYGSGI